LFIMICACSALAFSCITSFHSSHSNAALTGMLVVHGFKASLHHVALFQSNQCGLSGGGMNQNCSTL
jgi:hypothetical protein